MNRNIKEGSLITVPASDDPNKSFRVWAIEEGDDMPLKIEGEVSFGGTVMESLRYEDVILAKGNENV